MFVKLNLPKSIRKFIRTEKARIRREIFESQKQDELIAELYKRFIKNKPAENIVQAGADAKPEKKQVKKIKKAKKAKK